jgi:hypothetical protein
MADREMHSDRADLAAKLQERSKEYEADAEVIEQILETRRMVVTENGAIAREN